MRQYKRVIIESLLAAFGLDAMILNQHGGDVIDDTHHVLRERYN